MKSFAQLIKDVPLISIRPAIAVILLCLVAVSVAHYLRPSHAAERGGVKLNALLPTQVGTWHEVKSNLVQMSLTPNGVDRSEAVAATYDDTAMTSYADPQGSVVMVALAYGRLQRQEGKIHRPELCYSAQGFNVAKAEPVALQGLAGGSTEKVQIHRLETAGNHRREIVSYWIRIGDLFSTSAFQTRTYIMRTGLAGKIPDGILFRVSQVIPSDLAGTALEEAYKRQEEFMATLANSLTGGAQQMLLGDRLTSQSGGLNAST